MLSLQPGERVLDVGCGIGGGDFYMAAKHGVIVHGIDLSVNMVLTALERASAGPSQVWAMLADETLQPWSKNNPPHLGIDLLTRLGSPLLSFASCSLM